MEEAQQDEFYLVVVENSNEESDQELNSPGSSSAPNDDDIPLKEHLQCKIEPSDDYDDNGIEDLNPCSETEQEVLQLVKCEELEIETDLEEVEHLEELNEELEENFSDPKETVDQILELMKKQDMKRPQLSGEPFLETRSGLFQCKYCQFKSVGRKSAVNHFATRHCDNGYLCLACDRHFKRKDTLLHHELYCSAEKSDLVRLARKMCRKTKQHKLSKKEFRAMKIPCKICGKMICRNNMSFHLGVHSGVKRFMCTRCPATFRANKTLKAHLNMHMSRKPYACHKCSKSYTSYDTLQAHILDHRGRMYQCHHCERSYKRKHRIIEHLRTHIDETAENECSQCGAIFSTRASLSQHQRSHRALIPCAECNQTFRTMAKYTVHAKKEHGSVIITRKKLLKMLPELIGISTGADQTVEIIDT